MESIFLPFTYGRLRLFWHEDFLFYHTVSVVYQAVSQCLLNLLKGSYDVRNTGVSLLRVAAELLLPPVGLVSGSPRRALVLLRIARDSNVQHDTPLEPATSSTMSWCHISHSHLLPRWT